MGDSTNEWQSIPDIDPVHNGVVDRTRLSYIVILGLVAAVIVWRTHRAYKNLRSKSNRKGESSDKRS